MSSAVEAGAHILRIRHASLLVVGDNAARPSMADAYLHFRASEAAFLLRTLVEAFHHSAYLVEDSFLLEGKHLDWVGMSNSRRHCMDYFNS